MFTVFIGIVAAHRIVAVATIRINTVVTLAIINSVASFGVLIRYCAGYVC